MDLAIQLTNAQNHHLKIICTNNRQNNCGTAPLNSLQKVYNMQVEKAHNYFVGNMQVLAHNGCYDHYYKCLRCKVIHGETNLFIEKCSGENNDHDLKKVYQCKFCSIPSRSMQEARNHKTMHVKTYGQYQCKICNIKFVAVEILRQHKQMHFSNNNTIFCNECDEFVSLKDTLSKNHDHLGLLRQIQRENKHHHMRLRLLPQAVPIINWGVQFYNLL